MSVLSVVAVYFIIWWVTLFAVLPWGVRSQAEAADVAPGTEPGAPTPSEPTVPSPDETPAPAPAEPGTVSPSAGEPSHEATGIGVIGGADE